jgi:SprT protein
LIYSLYMNARLEPRLESNAEVVVPLNDCAQEQVRAATQSYIDNASAIYGQPFAAVRVLFDLRGRIAGMYRVRDGLPEIRYNPWLFAKYFDDNLAVTVPHEVAHYVAHILHRRRRIRPHGPEWRAVLLDLGATDTARTCRYDMSGIPVRRQRLHAYRCSCRTHTLTTRRHNRVSKREMRYICRHCGGDLVFQT